MATVANLVIGLTAQGTAQVQGAMEELRKTGDRWKKSSAAAFLGLAGAVRIAEGAVDGLNAAIRRLAVEGLSIETVRASTEDFLRSVGESIPIVGQLGIKVGEFVHLVANPGYRQALKDQAELPAIYAEAAKNLERMTAAQKTLVDLEKRRTEAEDALAIAQATTEAQRNLAEYRAELNKITQDMAELRRQVGEAGLDVEQAERFYERIRQIEELERARAKAAFDAAEAKRKEAESTDFIAAGMKIINGLASDYKAVIEGAAKLSTDSAKAAAEAREKEAKYQAEVNEYLEEAERISNERFQEGLERMRKEKEAVLERAAGTTFRQSSRLTVGAAIKAPTLPQLNTTNSLLAQVVTNTENLGRAA